jgi:cardiolipin synthase A/B
MTAELVLWILAVALPLFHLLGILSAVRAVMDTRTAQGAVAWVISLVEFPLLAVPLYWVFGRRSFQGYRQAFRSERFQEVLKRAGLAERARQGGATLPPGMAERFGAFEHLGPMKFTEGNSVRLLVNGDATFAAMLEAVGAARNYVLLEFFIVKDDEIGRKLKEVLVRKAREGVRVMFLYDEIGSFSLTKAYRAELRAAGATMLPFHTTKGRGNRFQLNFRNHRKIVVVDGATAFTGGLNVGDEYLGRSAVKRLRPWRDTMVSVRGPVVMQLQAVWWFDWFWASGDAPDLVWDETPAPDGAMRAVTVAMGPADSLETCSLFFVDCINAARRRVWIASPYYIPDQAAETALTLAALRGVDVRIILPGAADHWLAWLARHTFLPDLDRKGIRVFAHGPGFMHQKVVLVDDDAAAVGTANLDSRSLRLNFELMLLVADTGFAAEVAAMLEADIRESREQDANSYAQKPFWFRLMAKAARLLDPIL